MGQSKPKERQVHSCRFEEWQLRLRQRRPKRKGQQIQTKKQKNHSTKEEKTRNTLTFMFTVKVIPISITKNCIMTEEPTNNLYILVFIAITIFGRLVWVAVGLSCTFVNLSSFDLQKKRNYHQNSSWQWDLTLTYYKPCIWAWYVG